MNERICGNSGTDTAVANVERLAKEYLDLTDGRKLEVEVSYSLGGQNFWQGTVEKRGYWLHCTPVRLTDHSREYTLGSGIKSFLLEVRRQSPKALAQAVEIAAQKKRAVIESVLSKQGLTLANPEDLPAAPRAPIAPVSGVVTEATPPKVPGMMLLTKEILGKLPPLGSQEENPDPMVWAKFFDPCGSWTWYAIEFDPVEGRFFGLVDGLECELGYFMLAELEAIRGRVGLGIERDRHFKPCPLSQVRARLGR